MPGATRRTLLGSATSLAAAGVFAGSLQNTSSVAQSVAGSSQYGVKALFFDVFGTLVDWRTGIAREAESHLKSRGYALDWLAFADAWRAQYQPAMEEVRAGRIPFSKLDVLHRRNLDVVLRDFGLERVDEATRVNLNLAWHRLDAWPDVAPGLAKLREKFLLAPCSNGHISIMANLARRNRLPWD